MVSRTDQNLLATSWYRKEITTLVFNLRKGLRFHNDETVSARFLVDIGCRMMHRVDVKKNMLISTLIYITDIIEVNQITVEFKTV